MKKYRQLQLVLGFKKYIKNKFLSLSKRKCFDVSYMFSRFMQLEKKNNNKKQRKKKEITFLAN